jgi:hypothetical protein
MLSRHSHSLIMLLLRIAAYLITCPFRWGPFGSRNPLAALRGGISPPPPPATNPAAAAAATAARRTHPLYATVSLQLLAEVINSRLFTTVRDSLGLTYDVSFEVRMLVLLCVCGGDGQLVL